ncbi:hypothetical protein [Actinomadura fibrosa]|uniref:Uncharacterized protein n=1 Tax=Actinomadura fibrosa TaxID=111802 RepID=A0ABW2XL08_9ACTN|nr:hypothetical protein [Actinomadura fibrosa]
MRFTRRLAIPVAVAAGAVLFSAPAALGAAPDWRKVPHSAEEGTLNDVAVLGGGDAWAVGLRQPPYETATPVAEHWDGSSWKAVPVPATPTGTGSLDGVSAVASNDVWAVGDSTGQGPVIRHWNGTAWTAVPPAAPPEGVHPGADRLNDVAAVSATDAWAVGLFSDWNAPGPATLIERWDGTRWSRVPAPSPGRLSNTLQSVAAVSASDVWAVGYYYGEKDTNVALVLHWDGRAWTRSPVTLPSGNTQLQSVTAVSAKDVWAVGDHEGRPFVLHWDGVRWRVLPEPAQTDSSLSAAATDGRGGVWAAGYRMTDGGTTSRPLFLHWTGGRWVTGTSEEAEGTVEGLTRVGGSIWAVGTTSPCSCYVAPPLVEVNGPLPK